MFQVVKLTTDSFLLCLVTYCAGYRNWKWSIQVIFYVSGTLCFEYYLNVNLKGICWSSVTKEGLPWVLKICYIECILLCVFIAEKMECSQIQQWVVTAGCAFYCSKLRLLLCLQHWGVYTPSEGAHECTQSVCTSVFGGMDYCAGQCSRHRYAWIPSRLSWWWAYFEVTSQLMAFYLNPMNNRDWHNDVEHVGPGRSF